MIRIFMWGLLLYIAYRIFISIFSSKKQRVNCKNSVGDALVTYRDPVCGVYISEEDAIIGRLAGERHYFCSNKCLEKFRETLRHT